MAGCGIPYGDTDFAVAPCYVVFNHKIGISPT